MRYKVTFRKRFNEAGEGSDDPTALLDDDVQDGVIQDKEFVEQLLPQALHNEDALEEDDSYWSFGTETWVYDVADNRVSEFMDAVKNSEVAMHCEEVPDESLTT